jgi:hypothetical protein
MNHYQDNQPHFLSYPCLTEEEMEALIPKLDDGRYKFETVNCFETTSKASLNKMAVIDFKTYNKDGIEFIVRDWFPFTNEMAHKIKKFWVCVDRPEMYNGRNCNTDFMYQCGVFDIKNRRDNKGILRPAVHVYVAPQELIKDQKVDEFGDKIPF